MNANIYTGNVQPNHKEFKIWVNDEGVIKTWNGTEWIEYGGGSSSDDKLIYYELNDGYKMNNMLSRAMRFHASVKSLIDGKYWFGSLAGTDKDGFSGEYPVTAIAFLPLDVDIDENDREAIIYRCTDLESFLEIALELGYGYPSFDQLVKRRITAEEYWDDTPPESLIIDVSGKNSFDDYFVNWEIPADQYKKMINGTLFRLSNEGGMSPYTTATYNPDYVLDNTLNFNEDEIHFEFANSWGGSSYWTGGRLPDGRCFIGYGVS